MWYWAVVGAQRINRIISSTKVFFIYLGTTVFCFYWKLFFLSYISAFFTDLNGEMNVNGVSTVHGSSVSAGSHPPSTPYPHMSGHHQSGVGYDYLWGGNPQYGPGMGASSGQSVHQKQPLPGIAQSQSQHHFQGHGQYQVNGGVEAPHQPPVASQANIPLTGSSQYWSRSNTAPQQMSYNSPSLYGTFQSQSHPGVAPSPHHQQQTLQQPAHPPSQQQILSLHQSHQQQQQQHYSMTTNGMPFYQHQSQPPSLPSPHSQQHSQAQSQTHMMSPAGQKFTPPRGSPQHHSLGRGSSSSPLPVVMSPTPVISPPIQDSGSAKGLSRDRSPHTSSAGMSSPLQGDLFWLWCFYMHSQPVFSDLHFDMLHFCVSSPLYCFQDILVLWFNDKSNFPRLQSVSFF